MTETQTELQFGTPAYKLHRGDAPDTSQAAAHSIDTTEAEARVLRAIKRYGEHGCTQDDVLSILSAYPYSTVTARFKALLDRKYITDTGERRPGRSGRGQRVVRATV